MSSARHLDAIQPLRLSWLIDYALFVYVCLFMCFTVQSDVFQPVLSYDGTMYTVTLASHLACPVAIEAPARKGLSGGWIFLIVLLSLITVYISGGCVYNTMTHGTTGMASFPNVGFWREVPSMVVVSYHIITVL